MPSSSAPPTIDLSVIDLSPERLSDPEGRKVETQKLIDSFSQAGFCMITGIPDYDRETLFQWHKWFYLQLSEDVRIEQLATKAFNPKNDNIYR